jgi:hypothetical protein
MEKKNYYTPEVKFHQLMAKSSMLAGSEIGGDGGDGDPAAKGGMLFFDEDED